MLLEYFLIRDFGYKEEHLSLNGTRYAIDQDKMGKNRKAWEEWIAAGESTQKRKNRALVCQVIVASVLTYRWVSLSVALEHLGGEIFSLTPAQAPERIKTAIEQCARLGWSPTRCRSEA